MNLVATRYEYYIELLQDLTRGEGRGTTTVIICHPRIEFLRQIAAQIQRQAQSETDVPPDSPSVNVNAGVSNAVISAYSFLTPALQLLAISQTIRLVYCATTYSLRAYLSTYSSEEGAGSVGRRRLIIVDLLSLHHATSEFTLQGLSRTFAAAVSAATGNVSNLTLLECKDAEDPSNPDRGAGLWDRQVPLLSGSIKIGLEGSRWAGRGLTIKRIASRWFVFEDKTEKTSSE